MAVHPGSRRTRWRSPRPRIQVTSASCMANEADIKTIAAGSSWLPHRWNLWFCVQKHEFQNFKLVLTLRPPGVGAKEADVASQAWHIGPNPVIDNRPHRCPDCPTGHPTKVNGAPLFAGGPPAGARSARSARSARRRSKLTLASPRTVVDPERKIGALTLRSKDERSQQGARAALPSQA